MRQQKFIFLFLFFFFISFTPKVFALTIVDTDITENTTWTQVQSPYLVKVPINIMDGVTLIIESGVIVKFDYGVDLSVEGVLNALGTKTEPIYFTSYADDSIGGDTNEDGGEFFPSAGDWGGLTVGSTNQLTLNHVSLRYGGGITLYNGGSIISDTLDSDQGILLIGSHSSFTNLTIPSIKIFNGSMVSIDTAKISNLDNDYDRGSSIYVYNDSSLTFKNAIVENTGFDDIVYIFGNSSASFDSVNITGNVFSGVGVYVFNNSSLNVNKSSITDSDSGLKVFDKSSVIFNDSLMKNTYSTYSGAVEVSDNSSFSANGSTFDTGFSDGIDVFSNTDGAKLALSHSTVKNFLGSGVADFGGNNLYSSNVISIDHSTLTGNNIGLDIYNASRDAPSIVNVSNNSIYDNSFLGAQTYSEIITLPLANNWWGDKTGPYHETSNPNGLGDSVSDFINFTPFCKNESCISHNPVIIIPGVMGTEINRTTESGIEKLWLDLAHNLTDIGDEFMDSLQFNVDLTPSDTSLTIGDVIKKEIVTILGFESKLFDYTASLLEEFQNQGYVEGTDLFLFPYDWRYGVSEDNVNQLKQKIADVLTQTSAEKVDIVAHSMGGLLAKKYIIENPENNNIDKAVFVGVPNTGAPKAIKALIQGDGNLLTADSEMKKISQNIPAAYDLLPSEQYFNIKGPYVKIIDQYTLSKKSRDLNFEESNIFVINDHKLNAQALVDANNLHIADFDNYDLRTAGVDLYAINGCKAGTTGRFIEARYHGLFGGDDYTINNFKIEEIPGDGTVPLESATNLPINEANKFYALKGEHGQMLSQEGTRQKIVNIISGSTLSTQDGGSHEIITQDISECKLNGRAISVFSPLSIDIVDQDGNHSGLASDGVSIENNIPNADFQIIDEHKFVYLPTDEGQTYTISVVGTGTGTFTITDATIEENNVTQTQVFSNISVTPSLIGSISLSNNTNTVLSLDTDGDGATDQTLEPTSILNASESQDFVPEPPVNNSPEDDEEDIPPTQDNSQNNTPVVSGGRGGSFLLAVSQNNTPIQPVDNTLVLLPIILAEIPAETFIAKQENTTLEILVPIKKIKNTELIKIPPKIESLPEESVLTANVVDSKNAISNTVVVTTFAGVVIIFLLAKKFIKL